MSKAEVLASLRRSKDESFRAAYQRRHDDNCRAKLVGCVTYGKGVIQGVFGLSDGGALIETVASYSTPSREEINRRGVTPDEKKTFVSDVLGAGFVDADVKAATIAPRTRNGVCPTNTGAPKQPTGSSLLSATTEQ